MRTVRFSVALPLLVGLYLLASFLLTGCNKAVPSPEPAGSDPIAAGKKIFEVQNCARCHAVGSASQAMAQAPGAPRASGPGPAGAGPGGPGRGPGGGMKGPDLAKVGANAEHSRRW